MSEAPCIWSTECSLPSVRGAGKRLVDELLAQLHRANWCEHDIFGVQLAVEEALVNAIMHGNQHDHRKEVRVACRLLPDRLWIEISDEGGGFDPHCVPDCTADDRLDCPTGRGLKLMRSFMSRVEFNEHGNRVVMEKDRRLHAPPGSGHSATQQRQ